MNHMGVFHNRPKLYYIFLSLLILCSQQLPAQSPALENINALNSPFPELDPVVAADGSTLYFTRDRHPENIGGIASQGDIWYSVKNEQGQWTTPKNLGAPLNNSQRNAVAGFSADGNIMYLQHHYSKNGRPGTQGISRSLKKGGGWTFPEKVNIPYFKNESGHLSLCVSRDGRIMVMAIESYGSYGSEDLYISFKENGNWTEPLNLGSTINTRFQEMTPYLAADNATLYFASNGHGGFGSRDIFVTRRLDNTWKEWSEPENLGRPVNSEGVELSYVLSPVENYAYFVSTQNSDGYGDIYRIRVSPEDMPEGIAAVEIEQEEFSEPDTIIVIPQTNETASVLPGDAATETPAEENMVRVDGVVLNKKTNAPIKALLTFEDKTSGSVKIINTEAGGNYMLSLPGGQYTVYVSAEGYLAVEEEFSTAGLNAPSFNKKYYLSPLDVGTTVQLDNVLFQRGTANMLKDSERELDRVVRMLKENPKMRIKISGHTDNRGDYRLNIKLSRERAKTVERYLLDQGIAPDRLKVKGYGGAKPIASNSTEATRRLNRRVEFTVLDLGD